MTAECLEVFYSEGIRTNRTYGSRPVTIHPIHRCARATQKPPPPLQSLHLPSGSLACPLCQDG